MEIKRILLPTDFSDTAAKALKQALFLTAMFNAELVVLHARVLYEDDAAQLPKELARLHDEEEEMERAILNYMKECTKGKDHLTIKHELIRGYSAPSAILGYLNNNPFDLVVIGTHGRTGLEHFLIGSVAEKVVRYAPCPVLTISRKAEAETEFKTILVPFDFSEHARLALKNALEWAALFEAKLHLLYVIEKDVHPALYSWGMKSVLDIVPDIKVKAEAKMDSILKELHVPQNISVEKRIVEGVPHKEIAKVADQLSVDLVVIATHGLVGLDRFLLGSTTERLIRSLNRPILTLKQRKVI